jgi:hypothetical protein
MLLLLAVGSAQAQAVDTNPATAATGSRVAPRPPANHDNLLLTPIVQNGVTQPPIQPVVLPPSQMPPSPPRISYVGGNLTVVANNATLDDVLAGIGKAIDADIQGNGLQGVERVFGQFGPGSPSQVLDTLLIGSRYDFVLVGSAGNADSVREIILSPSSADPNQAAQSAPAQPSAQNINGTDSASLTDNNGDQPQAAQSPEERAGFRRNRRGPGARAIVRPQTLAPNTSGAPEPTPAPTIPQ